MTGCRTTTARRSQSLRPLLGNVTTFGRTHEDRAAEESCPRRQGTPREVCRRSGEDSPFGTILPSRRDPGTTNMAKFVRRHCRLLFVLFLIGIVAVPVGYSLRPLNPLERRLVGTWEMNPESQQRLPTYHLGADRRYAVTYGWHADAISEEGSWEVSGNQLRMWPDLHWPRSWGGVFQQLRVLVLGTRPRYPVRSIRFHSDRLLTFSDSAVIRWERPQQPRKLPPRR